MKSFFSNTSFYLVSVLFFSTLSVYADDIYEENDTFASAQVLDLGWYNDLVLEDAADWYRFDDIEPGLFYVKLEHPAGNPLQDLNVQIHNDQGILVRTADNPAATTEEVIYQSIGGGTLYVQVKAASPGGGNTYTLTVSDSLSATIDDVNENNDSFSSATELTQHNTLIPDLIASDVDFFRATIPPGTLTVGLQYSNTLEELDLVVYNSSGVPLVQTLGADASVISGGKQLVFNVDYSQEIRLAILGRQGTGYSLELSHPVRWVTTLDSGPATIGSPALFDIDGDGKDEIFIGTRQYLDGSLVEQLPARLYCLEDDGSVKWSKEFPASPQADPKTGLTYTSTAVTTRPAVADIDNDGEFEVVVGVGADLDSIINGEIHAPGHLGGVYSVDALTGTTEWFRESIDGPSLADGLPDPVYSGPVVVDIDQNGSKEVGWGGWDQRVYLVNGADGTDYSDGPNSRWPVFVYDTNWSSPVFADIDNDGLQEMLIGGDVTEFAPAVTQTGGWFHVFDRWGRDLIPGFRDFIDFIPGSNNFSFFKGKYEEQTIWSSPVVGDLDGDDFLEIGYGTGLFFDEPVGNYIRIWNHDGTEYLKLPTVGRVFSIPLFADLDNDGDLEIIALSVRGYVHVWDHLGNQLFASQAVVPPGGESPPEEPIYSSPLAVDLDGDNQMEIVFQQSGVVAVFRNDGTQLNSTASWGLRNIFTRGTPAIKDINADGNLDIVTGGTDRDFRHGVVYAFEWSSDGNALEGNYRYGRRQLREIGVIPISEDQTVRREQVSGFVSRFYTEVLERVPDQVGLAGWTNNLVGGSGSGADVARGFVLSSEFVGRGVSDSDFLDIMYAAFFARPADEGGKNGWQSLIDSGTSRAQVLEGFLGSQEFFSLAASFEITPLFSATQGPTRLLVEEFVTRFYLQALQREPDGAGLQGWTDALMTGELTGADVGRGFTNSVEFTQRNLNDEDFTQALYRAFFGRVGDEGGLAGWMSALEAGSLSRSEVVEGFFNSQEFLNLCADYQIVCP